MLQDEVEKLLESEEKRVALGVRASQAVVSRKGVVGRCVCRMLERI
jgi:hypothetical protein